MYDKEQFIIHTVRIIAYQNNQCLKQVLITIILSYYRRLNSTLSIATRKFTGTVERRKHQVEKFLIVKLHSFTIF
jgi:hypothetical protein